MNTAKLRRLLQEVREADPEMTVQHLMFLVVLAESGETPMRKLADKVGVAPSSISRTADKFGSRGARDSARAGLGFTVDYPNPDDERITLVKLTDKGVEFVSKLCRLAGG